MPGIDGLETAKLLRQKNCICSIIFTTSFPQFMIDSFEVQAFRFERQAHVGEVWIRFGLCGHLGYQWNGSREWTCAPVIEQGFGRMYWTLYRDLFGDACDGYFESK